ncbi:phosphopantetheine-binding protein [Pseudomonas sp. St316]|uniref:phosphopantetheine-binding protein n=1 Tax=Pseudomonas sp. St316 TaxID=2678257 RepID=UPI001BB3788F|nr:phosphopantetheine-binding protein [Pseudomonas sp. St316]
MSLPAVEGCVEFQIIKLLSGYFSASRSISGCSRLVEDLCADSVDVVEIVMMIDETFNVELSSRQVAQWRSVADIVNSLVESQNALK